MLYKGLFHLFYFPNHLTNNTGEDKAATIYIAFLFTPFYALITVGQPFPVSTYCLILDRGTKCELHLQIWTIGNSLCIQLYVMYKAVTKQLSKVSVCEKCLSTSSYMYQCSSLKWIVNFFFVICPKLQFAILFIFPWHETSVLFHNHKRSIGLNEQKRMYCLSQLQ